MVHVGNIGLELLDDGLKKRRQIRIKGKNRVLVASTSPVSIDGNPFPIFFLERGLLAALFRSSEHRDLMAHSHERMGEVFNDALYATPKLWREIVEQEEHSHASRLLNLPTKASP
jgi:hypothetical protein